MSNRYGMSGDRRTDVDAHDYRADMLDEVKRIVTSDRNSSYGEPEDNFKAIADIWSAQGVSIDGKAIQPHDVALMMAGMKLARLRHDPTNRDSWVDTAGYIACGYHATKKTGVDSRPSLQEVVNRVWQEGDKANVDELEERRRAQESSGVSKLSATESDGAGVRSGWVSDNRCQPENPFPHEAHGYRRGINGKAIPDANGTWCDGYVDVGHKAQQHADVQAVQRVYDKLKSKECTGERAHAICTEDNCRVFKDPTHPDNWRPLLDQDY